MCYWNVSFSFSRLDSQICIKFAWLAQIVYEKIRQSFPEGILSFFLTKKLGKSGKLKSSKFNICKYLLIHV